MEQVGKYLRKDVPLKFDAGKPALHFLLNESTNEIGKALTYGAEKYSAYNYKQNGGLAQSQLMSAALRHMNQYWCGEDLDKESRVHHLACASANMVMLLDMIKNNTGRDDRYKK